MPDPERGEAVLLATLSVREADILASLLAHHLINICTSSMLMVLLLVRISCRQQNYRSRGKFIPSLLQKLCFPNIPQRTQSMTVISDHMRATLFFPPGCAETRHGTKRAQRSIQSDLPPNSRKTHRPKPSVRRRTANEAPGSSRATCVFAEWKTPPSTQRSDLYKYSEYVFATNYAVPIDDRYIILYFLNLVFFSN